LELLLLLVLIAATDRTAVPSVRCGGIQRLVSRQVFAELCKLMKNEALAHYVDKDTLAGAHAHARTDSAE
jgi:hypothetical protein